MRSFSPSINIVRDIDSPIQYIPTANAHRIYNQILADYVVGIHAFSIIGSYGTGKSAFLLALNDALNGKSDHFAAPNGHLGSLKGVKFNSIVGSYSSIIDVFSQKFDVAAQPDAILEKIQELHDATVAQGYGLALLVDEFGKFLEHAAQSNSNQDLYFVQQLAEFVNSPDRQMMFITVLHQNFSTYGVGLGREQREEWEKVKGRLKELTFNEPIEQLLELAANFTGNGHRTQPDGDFAKLVETIDLSAAFPHRNRLTVDFAAKLLPFDILAASVLTQALQRYGQNERSLFTFLNANDYKGINDYDKSEHPYYNLVCVYDYLTHNYESLLNSVHNPHYAQWGVARQTEQRAEAELPLSIATSAIKIIRVIGLLSIFAPAGARINASFLEEYGRLALGLRDIPTLLAELETRKLIRYIRFKDTFNLFEGTDLNIELALMEAEGKTTPTLNLVPSLQEHFDFPLLLAKRVSLITGTPRFFQYVLSEEPASVQPEGIIDGTINLVFSHTVNVPNLESMLLQKNPTMLYGLYQNTNEIRQIVHEIEKISYVLGENRDDRVAVRELQSLKVEQIRQLNLRILEGIYNPSAVKWIWHGQEKSIRNARDLNDLLSQICQSVYTNTPVFQYELVNRHGVSSAVSTARKRLFERLERHWDAVDLNFDEDKFPAEKGIYLALLKDPGLHRLQDEEWILDRPTDSSFQSLWDCCVDFLDEARTSPKDLIQLVELLSRPPFKLKAGFISFWVPIFIFAKREEFALYHEGVYVPTITADTLNLIERDPSKFRIKTFAIEGVRLRFFNRCRALLQQTPSERISNSGFIETIGPFLSFFRSLPPYSQQTMKLEATTLRLREVIAKATDPERVFFEEFPLALGIGSIDQDHTSDDTIEEFIARLQQSIRELRTSYDNLVDRVESFLLDILGDPQGQFPAYREKLTERFATLRPAEMLPKQRTLYVRLTSALDDRDAWLNSIVQVVLGRDIRRMKDEDEEVVYTKLRGALQELDNLCKIDALNADLQHEFPPVSIEVTTTQQGSKKWLHRLTRDKEPKVLSLEEKLRGAVYRRQSSQCRCFG